MLDVDVLLGYDDSGEGALEYPSTIASQPRRPLSYILEDYNQSVGSPAPSASAQSPLVASFHRSNLAYDRSATTPMQPLHQQFVESMFERQQAHAHTHAAAASPASVFNSDTDTVSTDKIRLNLVWDQTSMNFWIDLGADGEAFFDAFQRRVEPRKGAFDRAEITIIFKRNKQAPDDEAYALSLEESELEADWPATLEWLEENKTGKPPRIYGRVQVGEG